jgi:hypothetical protein
MVQNRSDKTDFCQVPLTHANPQRPAYLCEAEAYTKVRNSCEYQSAGYWSPVCFEHSPTNRTPIRGDGQTSEECNESDDANAKSLVRDY